MQLSSWAERSRHRVTLLATLMLSLSACAESVKRPPAAAASTAPQAEFSAQSSMAPSFEKVPPEENVSLVRPSPGEGGASAGSYRFEVEDELDISVYGESDLQHVLVPVRPDGMISFAFVGDVMAVGRTIEEVRQEITERLAKYLRSPHVTVIAKGFAKKKVFIGGEVKSPGVHFLGGKEGTLLDALYKAGLATEKANLEGAYIMRGNRIVAADFKELVRGDVGRNVRLMDQDVVYVPENVNRYVYVLGEIQRNDALEVQDPVPIIQVISRAGGLTNDAKRREIAVIRGGLKAPEVAVVDAKRLLAGDFSQNIMVLPGDIVFVPTSALGKYNNFIEQVLRSIAPIVQGTILSNTANP